MGYVLARNAFEDFRKRVDYSEYGGAPLLGVKGVCIICHGKFEHQRRQERHTGRHGIS